MARIIGKSAFIICEDSNGEIVKFPLVAKTTVHPNAVDLAERHLGVVEAERIVKDANTKS